MTTPNHSSEPFIGLENHLWRALLDNLPVNLVLLDRQGRVTFGNALYLRTIGRTLADVLGKTDFDLSPEALAQKHWRDTCQVMETGVAFEDVEQQHHPQGEDRCVQVLKTPVRDAQGAIAGVQILFWDVTEREQGKQELVRERDRLHQAHAELEQRVAERTAELTRAAAALREQIAEREQTEKALTLEHDLLRALLDKSPDAIYFKDRESRFVRCSRAFAEITRLHDAAEAIGNTDFDYFTPAEAQAAFEGEQEIIRTGEPILDKVDRETWPGGRVGWANTSKMPWRNAQGEIIGTLGFSRDITRLKEAEVEIERMYRKLVETSRLAGMADVATGVLHNVGNVLNSVNVSATLVAEKLQRSKSASIAKVATLLNEHTTDLGAFMTQNEKGQKLPGYLNLLAKNIAREQQEVQRELASLRDNIDHIKEIVAMQQNYARVSGVIETVSVRELVEDALKMHSGAYLRHAVQLNREYAETPPIATDKHKVLQILVNVLHNAKYACDESESSRADKQVTVRIAKSGEDRVQIEVADNGIGIPAANLTKIFNHGFTTRKGGHGFGLHSGALAAKELGGALSVVSEGLGKGATFVLELPLKHEPAERT